MTTSLPHDYHDSYSPRQWVIHAIRHLDRSMLGKPFDHGGIDAIAVLVRAMVDL